MLDGEPLSPELVLVSPDLAERARALLPDRPEFPPPGRALAAVPATGLERLGVPELEQLRHDHATARERLDELTALVDRIADGWQQVDDRLARLERAVARMEAALAVAATPPPPPIEAEPLREAAPGQRSVADRWRETWARSGLVGTFAFVASVIAAMLAVELLPSLGDRPRLAVVSEGAVPTASVGTATEPSLAPETTAPVEARPPTTRPQPRRITTRPAETAGSSAAPETSASTTVERSDEPQPTTVPRTRPAAPPATTARAPTPTPTPTPTRTSPPTDFEPARVFLWPAADGATFYAVRFLRNGSAFYSARVSKPRLALPESIRFRPGSYRWIVRPGTAGQPLRAPIVDSTFTVEPG